MATTKDELTTEALELLKAIDAYKVGEDIREKVTDKLKGEYNKLRDTVFLWHKSGHTDEGIVNGLEKVETIWCQDTYEDSLDYKHKDGSWKLRTLLPPAYSSAKAVVLKALKIGVLDDTSGKSELERKIKGAVVKTPLSWDEAMRADFERFTKHLDDQVGDPPDPLILGGVMGCILLMKEHYEAKVRSI